jgi:hypothetical protein
MTDIIKLISQDPTITSINNTDIPNKEYLKSLENDKFFRKK